MTVRSDRIANVQALRAIAALLVLVMHAVGRQVRYYGAHDASTLFVGRIVRSIGHLGVDVFFVISGFIIFTVAQRAARGGEVARLWSAAHFMWRRALRIYPLYWLAAAVMVGITSWLASAKPLPRAVPVWRQLLLLTRTIGLLPLAWTLTFEMYFYAMVALALVVGGRRAMLVIAGWIVAEAALIAGWGIAPESVMFLEPWSRTVALDPLVLEFGLGCGVAMVIARTPRLPAGLALLAAAALIAAGAYDLYQLNDSLNVTLDPYKRLAFFGVGGALLLYASIVLEHRGRLAPRWLRSLGDASYSLYLWHVPVIAIVAESGRRLAGGFIQPGLTMAAIAGALAILVARASYRYLERPLLAR